LTVPFGKQGKITDIAQSCHISMIIIWNWQVPRPEGRRLLEIHLCEPWCSGPACSGAIQFSIQRIGGFKNMLFGGEGLFPACLIGTGKVYLQSMPVMNPAEALSPYLPRGEAVTDNTAIGIVGGLLRGR